MSYTQPRLSKSTFNPNWIALLIIALVVFDGLMLLPMILDGGTHMVSDMLSGVGHGFRDTNQWLAYITGNLLPLSFYQGDALGSFNSWMRLITGLLFGFAIGWFIYTYIDATVWTQVDVEASNSLPENMLQEPAVGQLGTRPN